MKKSLLQKDWVLSLLRNSFIYREKRNCTNIEESATSFQILRCIDKHCFYRRSNACSRRERNQSPWGARLHDRKPRRSTPTINDMDVTCVIRIEGKRKYHAQLTEIHICTYVWDKSGLHTRMNDYLLSLEIDSLRNVPIVNHSRTRVCKSCAATTSIRTFKCMHNSLIEAFGIINGAWRLQVF